MRPRHQISRNAIELIKRFEGYRRKAARLADGRWTIGYGHTLTARKGAEVSEADAEALLVYDLIAVTHAVNEAVYAPLNQNQFDALCSFVFNVGTENFRGSAVLRRLNEGEPLRAACAMELWRKSDVAGERIVVDALVRRRAAEKTLFLTPTGGWVPAPTPVVRPALDLDIAGETPRQEPAEVQAPLDGEAAAAEATAAEPSARAAPSERSAAQAAAGGVTARLQSLFPDPATAKAGSQEPFVLTPPNMDDAAAPGEARAFGRRETVAGEAAPGLFDREHRPSPDEPGATDWPIQSTKPAAPAATSASTTGLTPPAARRRKQDLSAIWALGAAGLGLFLLGLIGALNPSRSSSGPGGVAILGWLAGLVGVALLGVAAYRLLQRLGAEARRDRGAP